MRVGSKHKLLGHGSVQALDFQANEASWLPYVFSRDVFWEVEIVDKIVEKPEDLALYLSRAMWHVRGLR